jgi:thiamine pyrophosphokinase
VDRHTTVVLAGGDPVDPADRSLVPADAFVVAADSGLDSALALDIHVDLVIGDMDSVSAAALRQAESSGTRIERHPVDKDATDLELALDAALEAGAKEIIILGGHGGRLDHLLGNALLLASPRYAAPDMKWQIGSATVTPCRPGRTTLIAGAPGDRVSLLPIGGPATTIVTTGLTWPLAAEDLLPGSTRGISNEMTGPTATVEVGSGVLLVIHERCE